MTKKRYSAVTLAVGCFASMAIAVGTSVSLGNRAIERERENRENARAATCLVINRITEAYKIDTPTSEAGKNVAAAWSDLALAFGCRKQG